MKNIKKGYTFKKIFNIFLKLLSCNTFIIFKYVILYKGILKILGILYKSIFIY